MRHYVTLGQTHTHSIRGLTLDKDCVVCYEAPDAEKGREKAFELFGRQFCFHYTENEWDPTNMKYFPRGYIDLD